MAAKRTLAIGLGVLSFVSSGCKTTPDASSSQVKDLSTPGGYVNLTTADKPTDIPPLTCSAGDPVSFMMTAPTPAVTGTDVQLPKDVGGSPLELTPAAATNNVRFDVCVNSSVSPSTASLRRLVLVGDSVVRAGDGGNFSILTPPMPTDSVDLANVLSQSPGNVDIRVPYQVMSRGATFEFSLRVQSWNVRGQVVVTVTRLIRKLNPDGSQLGDDTGFQTVVGQLTVGDPVVADPSKAGQCSNGQPPETISFKIETAAFTAQTCKLFGTAGTNIYTIVSFSAIALGKIDPVALS